MRPDKLGVVLLMMAVAASSPGKAAQTTRPELENGLTRLYNFDFKDTDAVFQRYTTGNPGDPLGHAFRAAGLLFSELYRMHILESEFFKDDTRIKEKKAPQPDPAVRKKLFDAVDQSMSLSTAALAANPNDKNALFSMCVSNGVLLDYTSLVDKRLIRSISYARDANTYAVRLLKLDPTFYDANLTVGFSEYLLGSMPFFVRWFIRFDEVKGDKEIGREKLLLVAEKGNYLRSFAKLLLALFYLREDEVAKSHPLLVELTKQYPENEMLRRELAKLTLKLGNRASIAGQ